MIKIAIMTFSHPSNMNYGAMLQSFALFSAIKDSGGFPAIIDWEIKRKQKLTFHDCRKGNLLQTAFMVLKRIVGFYLHDTLTRIACLCGEKAFSDFSAQYLPVKTRHCTLNGLPELNQEYDYFITGSDQVWRYNSTPDIGAFMLNFVSDDKTKISYAASFGTETWEAPENITAHAKVWLSRFAAISVREDSGKKICRDSFGIDTACRVLDPTLLLTAKKYNEIADEDIQQMPNGKYAVCMMLDEKNHKKKYQEIEKQIGIPLLPLKGKTYDFPFISFTKYNSIPHWLNLIRNAEYVITDSFHCMVFSLIFHKRFVVIINQNRGAARIHDIAQELGFTQRIYNSISDLLKHAAWNDEIDYHPIDKKLDADRIFSFDFLKNAIKENTRSN